MQSLSSASSGIHMYSTHKYLPEFRRRLKVYLSLIHIQMCIRDSVYPVYFGFRGGKGVVTVAVMILCQNPFVFLILLAVFVATVASTKYVSLGSCLCMVIYPYVLYNMTGYGSHIIIAVIAAAFVLFLHRENLKRLHEGKENKISFSKKNKVKNSDNKENK